MKNFLLGLALCCSLPACAQTAPTAPTPPAPPPAGANWQSVKVIPLHNKIHIAADSKGRKCNFVAADDESLTCSAGSSATAKKFTYARADVRSVKLTRYTASTLAGMGIGLGAGLAVGAVIGHVEDPPEPNQFLDFSSLGRGLITGVGGIVGFAAGGTIGGPTDFLRGPTIYRRP